MEGRQRQEADQVAELTPASVEPESTPESTVVRAAGGVVWRRRAGGALEVAVVHRPKYDDWSLPKGKLERGESHETAARREVQEETGLRCELGRELAGTAYVDRKGRPKSVRYWAMTVLDGAFRPSDEVDDLRWLTPDEAAARLSYPHDTAVVASLAGR